MLSARWVDTGWGDGARLVALAAATIALGHAAWHDARTERIPNRSLQVAGLVTLAGAIAAGPGVTLAVVAGGALAGVPMLIVLLARGIGMGDVKMAAVAGAAGGLVHPLVGVIAVMVMAVTVATVGAVTRRHRWALGPFIWLAFVGTAALAAAPLGGGGA